MSLLVPGQGRDAYPKNWHMPKPPWPHEEDEYDEDDKAWAKAATKANKIRNEIKKLERMLAKAEEWK